MAVNIAFMGFRHGHIFGLYGLAGEKTEIEVVAACEEDGATRKELAAGGKARITHEDYIRMLDTVDCDVVATGDYYGKRGAVMIEALKRGKHVIADKPLCTSLEELDQIETLSREKGLVVGCMLDQRGTGSSLTVRRMIHNGELGEIQAVSFGGQHPLNYGSRPGWYFEQGKHGGTINDIAIHALDSVPWITGLSFTEVNAARNWNAFLPEVPHFLDAAQFMLTMSNGCGVLGDVSYFAPNTQGYSNPLYWRTTYWGRKGVVETATAMKGVTLYMDGEKEGRTVPTDAAKPGGYLDAFLQEIGGGSEDLLLSSAEVLHSARVALTVQKAADERLTNVKL